MNRERFQILLEVQEQPSLQDARPPELDDVELPPGITDFRLLSRPGIPGPEAREGEQAMGSWTFTARADGLQPVEDLLERLDATLGDRQETEVLVEEPPHTPYFFGDDPRWPQDYLGGAEHRGIGLAPIRGEPGGWGENARVLVIESGWSRGHPDLPGRIVEFELEPGLMKLSVGPLQRKHGNAILGVICGQRNGQGIVGLVPDAPVEIGLHRPESSREGVTRSSLPELIGAAIDRAGAGDVVVLARHAIKWSKRDRQWRHTNPLGLEAFAAIRRQFREAEQRNVHVVAAAGNGLGMRLDDFCPGRNYPSGALVVGASSSTVDERLPFSNWGKRVDLHAWGERVATSTEEAYTAGFNGTSSATAIVAGVVALLSSHVKARTGRIIKPGQMKKLLVTTGSRPIPGIGKQPNVTAALARLKQVDYDLNRI